MTPLQHESPYDALEQESDELAVVISSLPTSRLCVIGDLINDELALRWQGKPADRNRLH
jgi:hypothetical protein